MRPQGTVYQSSTAASTSGELRIALTSQEKKHHKFMQMVGANLSSLALAFVVFVYGPPFELDMNYQAGLAKTVVLEREAVEEKAESEPQNIDEFAISIPAIGASAKVVSDVNPYNEEEYDAALRVGVAHAETTGKPGEGKRIFMFAHSTSSPTYFSEYNAIFYQLRLLSEGDLIFVKHNGEALRYKVTEKVVVEANDTHWLTDTSNEEELVLQTCDPPGTTLRRLLVIAKPVDNR